MIFRRIGGKSTHPMNAWRVNSLPMKGIVTPSRASRMKINSPVRAVSLVLACVLPLGEPGGGDSGATNFLAISQFETVNGYSTLIPLIEPILLNLLPMKIY